MTPEGPFSLQLAAGFGFGQREGNENDVMRLAFVADNFEHQVGVILRQPLVDGPILAEVEGEGDLAAIEAQVKRVLSLDYSGKDWLAVGEHDPIIANFQKQYHGLRPVLFYSPYEAAAWSVISNRKFGAQAKKIQRELSEQYGEVFDLAGEQLAAFPTPQALLGVKEFAGLDPVRVERLHAIAESALAGQLDVPHLHAMSSEEAIAAMRQLPGIGPFYAALIVIRGAGLADVLPDNEPRFISFVQQLYGLDHKPSQKEILAIAEHWRPFRTWACVLIRYAGGRQQLEWTK